MSGETNLDRLLATLSPGLDPEPYGFITSATPLSIAPVFAVIQETEGATVIAPLCALLARGMVVPDHWARITLRVHSSLQAVGLTAVVSGALAKAGISANMIAAFHHDHIFVPWAQRDEAMAILLGLQT